MRQEDREALGNKPRGRVSWSRRKWESRISARAAADHSVPEDADVLALLCSADPTPKALYLDWLCRTYAAGAFLAEDASRLRDTLTLFDRWKHRLPEGERDVGRHADEQSLWAAVERFDPSRDMAGEAEDAVGREKKRRERAKALAESETCEDEGMEGWICASPKTHYAAKWWGRGTRWCTSMEGGYQFKHYSDRGPLRVFVDPEGAKFQAHLATGACAEASDRSINFSAFVARLPAPAVAVLKADATALLASIGLSREEGGPVRNETDDSVLVHAITRIPHCLVDGGLVDRFREEGEKKVRTVLEDGGWRLRHVTREIAKWALGLHSGSYGSPSYLLLDVPGGPRIDAVLDGKGTAAFREMGAALLSAPDEFRDAVAVDVAQRFESKGGYRTSAELSAFLEGLGTGLMPREGWLAVAKMLSKRQRDWHDFAIPEACIDDEIADALAKGYSLRPIPPAMRTKARMMSVLARNPAVLASEVEEFGLTGMFDEEAAFALASSAAGDGLQHVPGRFRTRDFDLSVLAKHARALKHVAEEHLILEDCVSVMERNGNLVMDLPARFRQMRETWIAAVGSSPSVLCKVPKHFRDEDLCRRALDGSPDQFVHVPLPLGYDDYLKGVAVGGSNLARVPLPYRDVRMCVTALAKQADASAHVPPAVAALIREMPEHRSLLPHLKGRVSSRYPKTDPIFSWQPSPEMPETLTPLPAMLPAGAVSHRAETIKAIAA